MLRSLAFTALFLLPLSARGQIQVDLKFKRLQYIAFEPVIATVTITNLAGRDILLRDAGDQRWYGLKLPPTKAAFLLRSKRRPNRP